LILDNLRSPSGWSSATFVKPFIIGFKLMGKSEITYHQVSVIINQNIGHLDVSVDNFLFMKISKS
jgi:hypothetical protein